MCVSTVVRLELQGSYISYSYADLLGLSQKTGKMPYRAFARMGSMSVAAYSGPDSDCLRHWKTSFLILAERVDVHLLYLLYYQRSSFSHISQPLSSDSVDFACKSRIFTVFCQAKLNLRYVREMQ